MKNLSTSKSSTQTAEKIIETNVKTNVSCIVTNLIKQKSAYTDELIEITSNKCLATGVEEYGVKVIPEGNRWIYCFEDKCNSEKYSERHDAIKAAADSLDIKPRYFDVYEYYLVTDWLAGHLEQHGEAVARLSDEFIIWGRTTTGQAIFMDEVISEIAIGVDRSGK